MLQLWEVLMFYLSGLLFVNYISFLKHRTRIVFCIYVGVIQIFLDLIADALQN
jgi:hypothetical protein